jgi:hypothetical protein
MNTSSLPDERNFDAAADEEILTVDHAEVGAELSASFSAGCRQ